jgi:hypothetical protein
LRIIGHDFPLASTIVSSSLARLVAIG